MPPTLSAAHAETFAARVAPALTRTLEKRLTPAVVPPGGYAQTVPGGITIDPLAYADAVSPTNPNGNLLASEAFARLVDPAPQLGPDYAPTAVSVDRTYGIIVKFGRADALAAADAAHPVADEERPPSPAAPPALPGALVDGLREEARLRTAALADGAGPSAAPARGMAAVRPETRVVAEDDPAIVQMVLYEAQKQYMASAYAGHMGDFSVWHMTYATPDDWWDSEAPGFAPVTLRLPEQDVTVRMNARVVLVTRPWLEAEVLSMQGWNLRPAFPPGSMSQGTPAPDGPVIMPLIPVTFVVARDVEVVGDPGVLAALGEGAAEGARAALGPVALAGPGAPPAVEGGVLRVPGMQIVGWGSMIVPFCPPS